MFPGLEIAFAEVLPRIGLALRLGYYCMLNGEDIGGTVVIFRDDIVARFGIHSKDLGSGVVEITPEDLAFLREAGELAIRIWARRNGEEAMRKNCAAMGAQAAAIFNNDSRPPRTREEFLAQLRREL